METFGQIIIYVMMAFLLAGAVMSLINDQSGIGKEFKEGIYSIGPIFLPVAGIMCLIPILSDLISTYVAPVYAWIHSDPALAATTLIAGDMGGFQLAYETAGSHSAWILAFAVSFTAGSTIIFSIPVGLAMLRERDHKYMALGVMAGLLAIPFAVFIMALLLQTTGTPLREDISTTADSTRPFDMPMTEILTNLVPITIFVVLLALGLRFLTGFMVKAFIVFGRVLDAAIKIALALAVVQYFTGVFDVFGAWPLAPFIADEEDQFRALEVAGYIGVMLAGAFPMVYAIRTWLATPLRIVGGRLGFSEQGAAGLLAGAANILALFRVVHLMPARDKVLTIAFGVCAAFAFGDHLAFAANFQPNMVGAFIIGKLAGGVIGILLALWLALPYARVLAARDAAEAELTEASGTDDPGGRAADASPTDDGSPAPQPRVSS
ncbi:ethanolamine utilization protein EutH [Spiractinospora alimapuensis]|uniref:ethanolamine utilization protein EutH n=1 Tax=Spiractinospora alimapuensis TaxID=2820884 RepID=UPI001F22EFCF|nr:ethanolamine utilization protein EutH [Spiractinospora alimapuensis]QVQ50838.1 ethanolamine utilization protein EutH [Spiractinospora alimapuensis]